MPVAERMTAEEFLALPDSPELRHAQLVEGELILDAPTPQHQWVRGELHYELSSWTRAREGRGWVWFELAVRFGERNVFQPDLLWYPDGAGPALGDKPPSPLPRLAVEVRSPSTWRYDIGAKKAAYERHGLAELWLIDTKASELLVFRRSSSEARAFDVALELERDETVTSPLLDGFGLPLTALFPAAD